MPATRRFHSAYNVKRVVRSRVPDIVFTYPRCTECEADYLLSSFRFDSSEAKWKLRIWSKEGGAEILIDSDYSVGTDEDSKDVCLFKFADFTGEGFDDLADRCVATTRRGRVLADTTTIYTVQHGQSQILTTTDPRQLATIYEQLCVGVKKSKLCLSK